MSRGEGRGEAARPASGHRVSPARRAAYEVLRRTFEHGAWADRALASAVERHRLEGRDLALARRLAYGAVQRRATTDHIAECLGDRPTGRLDRPVQAALRLGVYELLFTGSASDHAAVDHAVELAKGGMTRAAPRRATAASGFVNAVLRRVAGDGRAVLSRLGDSTPEEAAIAHSYPVWIARMWWSELGADCARAVMSAMNEPAEVSLRVNPLRAGRAELLRELRAAGVDVSAGSGRDLLEPADCLTIEGGVGEAGRAAIAAGRAIPQSRASQAVVALLGPRPGQRVLDVCAGPGIKTTQIAAHMHDEGQVSSFELDPGRAAQVEELCTRARATSVRVAVGDAAVDDLGEGYDRALVDPPCTDLGTLASRPDARWRKSPEQVGRLAALQRALLERACRALRPGGVAVYSTCTISSRENEAVVNEVLAANPALRADELGREHAALAAPGDSRFLQIRPDRDRTAGFFVARLRRA